MTQVSSKPKKRVKGLTTNIQNDFRDHLVRRTRTGREAWRYIPLRLGSIELSIQADATSRCEPRKNYQDPYRYESWEVRMFEGRGTIDPSNDPRFKTMEGSGRFQEELGRYTAAFVPTEDVQIIFDFCSSLVPNKASQTNPLFETVPDNLASLRGR